MIVVDANVLIAFWDRQDAHFSAATELLRAHASSVMHPINLAEALVQIVRHGAEERARTELVALGVQQAEASQVDAFALARARAETGLTMPDCCALLTAEELRLPLATVDRRLANVARQRGMRVLPAD